MSFSPHTFSRRICGRRGHCCRSPVAAAFLLLLLALVLGAPAPDGALVVGIAEEFVAQSLGMLNLEVGRLHPGFAIQLAYHALHSLARAHD